MVLERICLSLQEILLDHYFLLASFRQQAVVVVDFFSDNFGERFQEKRWVQLNMPGED